MRYNTVAGLRVYSLSIEYLNPYTVVRAQKSISTEKSITEKKVYQLKKKKKKNNQSTSFTENA